MKASAKSQMGEDEDVVVERHDAVEKPGSVCAVRFSREEMGAIRKAAHKAGVTTAEWIREAAREKAAKGHVSTSRPG